jgi:transcriptional regulator with XRE-family HTH domain
MTPAELKAALSTIGMKQNAMAEQMGLSANTISRYMSGELTVPKYIETHIGMLLDLRNLALKYGVAK